jgi:translation initiation factor 1
MKSSKTPTQSRLTLAQALAAVLDCAPSAATAAPQATQAVGGSSASALVYSTDSGRTCPACRQPVAQCDCHRSQIAPAPDGVLRVWRETKGRGGKAVTLVKGLGGDAALLAAQAKQLRTACGSGGTVKDGVVEVQGDHVDRVLALLQAQGHRVKRAGGA